jgi:hypothetical protein
MLAQYNLKGNLIINYRIFYNSAFNDETVFFVKQNALKFEFTH